MSNKPVAETTRSGTLGVWVDDAKIDLFFAAMDEKAPLLRAAALAGISEHVARHLARTMGYGTRIKDALGAAPLPPQSTTIRAFVLAQIAAGERDWGRIQIEARKAFPDNPVGYNYIRRIMREQARAHAR
jgi:hypothetical protein